MFTGELITTARYIREFVTKHPDYKHDSIINDTVNYDLIKRCDDITRGTIQCSEMLMRYDTKSAETIPSAMEKAETYLDNKAASDGHAQ